MYLPNELPNARFLITVKTYPQPSNKYEELVCTAGLFDGRKWIRVYPVPYRFFIENSMYPKYSWVIVDLVRNKSDFRPESYRPNKGVDEVFTLDGIVDTKNNWAVRKSYIQSEVFLSMTELIALAKSEQNKSLATIQPQEVTNFIIENTDRDWKEKWKNHALQMSYLEYAKSSSTMKRRLVQKVPYNYYYELLTKGDSNPRKMQIEDWEIGSLYWNCLRITGGDETKANQLVRKKYFDDFVNNKDLYLFLGTTKRFHNIGPNPFMIIGVFYPPKSLQYQLC
jgi:hypothetical protein